MRIAILNSSSRWLGGAETHIARTIPPLLQGGHEVALWSEVDQPRERPPLVADSALPAWSVERMGHDGALKALADWHPDVLYDHGLIDPELEAQALAIAGAVVVAHGYYGTCISGRKTLTFPRVRACPHSFGWKCLVRYYPRRTGGLNPVTMMRAYRCQARRLQTLHSCRLIFVLSEHMRREYLNNGITAERLSRLPPLPLGTSPVAESRRWERAGRPRRLLFVGRMDPLKGGTLLLEAAPEIAARLCSRVVLTFAGDGPQRAHWEALGARIAARHSDVRIDFRGWLSGDELRRTYHEADLLVVPSLWPEPFGLVGLEAAAQALPATAFVTGGIPEWLEDGVNGTLAPADPPTAHGLAAAVVRALADPRGYEALSRGALAAARRLDERGYISAVLEGLERAAGSP